MAGLLLFISCAVAVAGVQPPVGGTADLSQTNAFAAPNWSMLIHSYAYVGTAGDDPQPPGLPEPGMGQTLFVYLADVALVSPDPINFFQVGDPPPAPVPTAGFSNTITPPGFEPRVRQNPSSVQVSLPARSVTYLFTGGNSLDAFEFSVLYFLADGVPGQVNATAIGGASTSETDMVLGPIPEPSSLLLMIAAMAASVIRRRASR